MIYSEKQKEWKDLITREIHGENIETFLEPGYKEEYSKWKEKFKELLPKQSADERVEGFTKHLQDLVSKKTTEVINGMDLSKKRREELLALAKKDQLLLVSKDGGLHFDQILTPQEAEQVDALQHRILSPSFISASNDLSAVVEAQTLIHVVNHLKKLGYNVDRADIKEHQVLVQVTMPKVSGEMESLEYRVDIKQEAGLPLEYKYLSGTKMKRVPETVLPENLGALKEDQSLIVPSQSELEQMLMLKSFKGPSKNGKANMALASFAAIYGARAGGQEARKIRAKQSHENAQKESFKFRTDGALSNVIASKQAMKTQRLEREKKWNTKSVHEKFQEKHDEKTRIKFFERQRGMDAQRIERRQKNRNKFKIGTLIGSVTGAGLMGGIGFLGIWSGQ